MDETEPQIHSVEGIFQLPLMVLTFPEEVDFIIDKFIKIDIGTAHPNIQRVYPLKKSLHYGVYLSVSYKSCDRCANGEPESDDHRHKAPFLKIPQLVYAKDVEVDESMNIMHDNYNPDPNIPLVNIGAAGLGSFSAGKEVESHE